MKYEKPPEKSFKKPSLIRIKFEIASVKGNGYKTHVFLDMSKDEAIIRIIK